MPVLVNPNICVDRDHCFAAGACPYGAFYHNALKRTWEVDATMCGTCPGPCLNFCDKDALRWGNDLEEIRLFKSEIEGKLKPQQVEEARLKHKQELERAAAEARKKEKEKEGQGIFALTRANFEQELLRSDLPVVVDCWADWCAPCKQFSPVFEATAKQYAGVLKFAKLDTEAEPALAQGLGVQALPTVMMFYKGQLVNVAEGALPAQQFQAWIYQTLAAIRQYEAQLQAEAEDAINTASQNMAALDGTPAQAGASPAADTSAQAAQPAEEPAQPEHRPQPRSAGVILDPDAGRRDNRGDDRPGKQTSSGLFIP